MSDTLQQELLAWYDAEKRDLPWRGQNDPYAIWVSEIMLQQTQVATVIPYYQQWMRRFPSVEALAEADPQQVLSAWQGLGYYRRCRLLQQGARYVAEHGSPGTASEWRKVPGVGRYTAGAIASIAHDEQAPLVDGNVLRVFARLTGTEAAGSELERLAWDWAGSVIPGSRPGDWNQALMELGATICRPVGPACPRCPLRAHCVANRDGTQLELPRKTAPPQTVALRETVWIPYSDGKIGVKQIPKGEWWESMWEFPRIRSHGSDDPPPRELGPGSTQYVGRLRYQVTRHKVDMEVHLHVGSEQSTSLVWLSFRELDALPMPSPQRRALKLAQAQGNLKG